MPTPLDHLTPVRTIALSQKVRLDHLGMIKAAMIGHDAAKAKRQLADWMNPMSFDTAERAIAKLEAWIRDERARRGEDSETTPRGVTGYAG